MKLGFTGTRSGMTEKQADAAERFMFGHEPVEMHHGCCVGADEQAAVLAHELGGIVVVGHPSDLAYTVSDRAKSVSARLAAAMPPLDRNRAIVDATDWLLACPRGSEERRSGSWATVRYARKLKRPIAIIWPDGKLTTENM